MGKGSRWLVMAVLAAFCAEALATGPPKAPDPPGQEQRQTASAESSAEASSDSSSSADNLGNSQSTTYSSREVREVASAYAAGGHNTASCVVGGGLGAQGALFGVSVNRARRDKDCVLEEAAERAYTRGQWSVGDKLTCRTSYMRKLYPRVEDCLLDVDVRVAVRREDDSGSDYVTRGELAERERRQMERGK
jgi:hypothetical protein